MPSNKVMTDGHRIARKRYPGPLDCEWTVPCDRPAERHHRDGNPMNNERANVWFLCKKHHIEAEQRFSQPAAVAKKLAALLGRTFSTSHRASLSTASAGRPKSDAHKAAISASLKGRSFGPKPPRTKTHRRRLSAALSGRVNGPMSAPRRKKISDALKAVWRQRKNSSMGVE